MNSPLLLLLLLLLSRRKEAIGVGRSASERSLMGSAAASNIGAVESRVMSHIAPSTGETSFRALLRPTATDNTTTAVCCIHNCRIVATAAAGGCAVAESSRSRRNQIVPNAMGLFLP